MGKSSRNREHVDPEYQRWCRKYPRFPGVGECARLIQASKAKGAWADIIVHELAENAGHSLTDLIEAFRTEKVGDVRMFVMMALEIAELPESVPFLAEVLQEGTPQFVSFAERALGLINTPEARTVLWKSGHADPGIAPGSGGAK